MPHYLDPEQVFPKRMGIMHGKILVLQYYDVARDKFKKHLIEFQAGDQPKDIVEKIYKNVKHVPYLKKVNPKNMRAVLEGNVIGYEKKGGSGFEEFKEERLGGQKYRPSQRAFEGEKENYVQDNYGRPEKALIEVYTPIVKPVEVVEKHREPEKKPQKEVDDYYDEEFEDFEMSHSMDKPATFSSSFSKVDPAVNDKSFVSKNSESIIIEPPKKEDKQKKKKKEKIQEPIEEVLEEFDFLDEDENAKKKKKEKKEKKEKKDKSKSKDKKSKKPKKEQNNTVEQEFQFL